MTFFASAAAAADAGFRPCLRCFPEYSPEYMGPQETSQTISRALRLIETGLIDECGVGGLAQRMGVSDRHLRRLFAEQLGTSPSAVAQTRRILLAKQLIHDTNLSFTRIAFASGFQSIRQFNGVIKKVFGRAPRTLRQRKGRADTTKQPFLKLKLGYRPPLGWDFLLGFMKPRLSAGIEDIQDRTYRRLVVTENESGIIEVTHAPEKHQLIVHIPNSLWMQVQWIKDRVSRLFDLRADPASISKHLRTSSDMAKVHRKDSGIRVPGCWDPFELSIRTILGQQVSVVGATTLCSRLIERWGDSHGSGTLRYQFPTPDQLADVDLSGIGIPASRAETLNRVAKAFALQRVHLDGSMSASEFVEAFTAIKGIGPWTSNYIAMRAFNDPDRYPPGDLGIKKALMQADPSLAWTPKQIDEHADQWRPWRSYAVMTLWNSLASA